MTWTITAVDVSTSADNEGHRTHSVTFRAVTDDTTKKSYSAWLAVATQYPPGTPYSLLGESDSWAFAQRPSRARAEKATNRKSYLVDVDFSTKPAEKCSNHNVENPLDEPVKISGSFVRATKVVTQDRLGEQLANSADEPWIPAAEIDDSRDTLIIEANTAGINLQQRGQARDKVNETPIWGLQPRAAKLSQWQWSIQKYGQCNLYVVNRLEFEINMDLWNDARLDEGFRIKDGVDADGNTKYKTLMDGQDQPLREPRLLDGQGDLLGPNANPVIVRKELYREFDFHSIGFLPDPLF